MIDSQIFRQGMVLYVSSRPGSDLDFHSAVTIEALVGRRGGSFFGLESRLWRICFLHDQLTLAPRSKLSKDLPEVLRHTLQSACCAWLPNFSLCFVSIAAMLMDVWTCW